MSKDERGYNGWKNYDTWNVALWIGNDEPLYRSAYEFMQTYKGRTPYASFVEWMELNGEKTPDDVRYDGRSLSYGELNRFMSELIR